MKIKRFNESLIDNDNNTREDFNEVINEFIVEIKRKYTEFSNLIDSYKIIEEDKAEEWDEIKHDLQYAFDAFKVELIRKTNKN